MSDNRAIALNVKDTDHNAFACGCSYGCRLAALPVFTSKINDLFLTSVREQLFHTNYRGWEQMGKKQRKNCKFPIKIL